MAIPITPTGFAVQTGNGQNLVSWNISAGATSYVVQRSLDGVNYTGLVTLSGIPLATSYLDTGVVIGVQYWYQVASANVSGQSPYSSSSSVIPTTTGEMSLAQIRLAAKQRANMENSGFVQDTEWNSYINQAMFQLYDLLVTCYENYFMAPPAAFQVTGGQYLYNLPNGQNTFLDNNFNPFTPPPFYKLEGVDLALSSANNAWVTVNKFQFEARNTFVYPNTASTIYGVFNLQYRVIGNQIEFIPTPSAGQYIRLWYTPRLNQLLQDTDVTTVSVSGWIEYVIVRAAILALTKEESDTSGLVLQLTDIQKRIEETAMNRDAGFPDKITDVRNNGFWGSNSGGYGGSGPLGGF